MRKERIPGAAYASFVAICLLSIGFGDRLLLNGKLVYPFVDGHTADAAKILNSMLRRDVFESLRTRASNADSHWRTRHQRVMLEPF